MALHIFRRSTAASRDEAADTEILEVADAPATAAGPPATGLATAGWLLDRAKQVTGFRLGWRPDGERPDGAPAAQLRALVDAAAGGFVHREHGWRLGATALLIDMAPPALALADWQGLPPANVVLCWRERHFVDPGLRPALQSLREQGFGLMLCGAQCAPAEPQLRELATHFDVGAGDPALVAVGRSLARHPVQLVATGVADWAGFDACAALGVPVLASPALDAPPPDGPRQPLQPQSALLARLLQLVQRNEDVRVIEAALKHDAALTYRLLRHINSPAIGAGVEIASLRHAVAMLGYSRLFRWLSLLLAANEARSSPPYLMRKAIMRGRFVELLGQALLGPRHADSLFLVGMFSVIDRVLGIPMAQLLEKVQLADAIQLAILERRGMYGPLLALAIAAAAGASDTGRLAEELFMSPGQVNRAQLEAIAWSQAVSRSAAGC